MKTVTTIILAFCLVLAGCKSGTHLRVRNGTEHDFQNVEVHTDLIRTNGIFGNIPSGGVTEYRYFPEAYRYAFVTLSTKTKNFGLRPTDYVGEKPLGSGYFTYHLTLEGGRLNIRAEKDE